MNNTIIGGVIGIVGTLTGVLGTFLLQRISERRKLKEDYIYLKNKALRWIVVNNLNSQLLPIKEFFLRHPRFLKRVENRSFFDNWLSDHSIDSATEGVGLWSSERVQQMRESLQKTKV